jgi:hypothetical protein
MPARSTRRTADTVANLREDAPETDAPETAETAETATETAPKSTRGRKAMCRAAMANGQQCELPKGHEGQHNVTTLDEDEIADVEMTEEELAELLGETRTPGVRPTQQLVIDQQVAENYAEWMAAGANTSKPKWKVKKVAPEKRDATERRLRNAADFHTPQVGMRIKKGPIRDGKATVLWAAVKRMETSTDSDANSDGNDSE